MKIPKLIGAALLALASLAFAPRGATAATTTYTDGDLFLGFRATGETQNYLVNIGQPGSLASGSIPNVGGQLAATFGANWYNRTDLFFAVIGANSLGGGNDPANTVYSTRSNSIPWTRLNDGPASSVATLVSALGFTFADNTTSSSSNALLQNVASNNSYASFQPGGTRENSAGISFSTFAPSNEGTPKTLLYLNRLTPTSSAAGVVRFGTIGLAADGYRDLRARRSGRRHAGTLRAAARHHRRGRRPGFAEGDPRRRCEHRLQGHAQHLEWLGPGGRRLHGEDRSPCGLRGESDAGGGPRRCRRPARNSRGTAPSPPRSPARRTASRSARRVRFPSRSSKTKSSLRARSASRKQRPR
jgi:hypothetical protein